MAKIWCEIFTICILNFNEFWLKYVFCEITLFCTKRTEKMHIFIYNHISKIEFFNNSMFFFLIKILFASTNWPIFFTPVCNCNVIIFKGYSAHLNKNSYIQFFIWAICFYFLWWNLTASLTPKNEFLYILSFPLGWPYWCRKWYV